MPEGIVGLGKDLYFTSISVISRCFSTKSTSLPPLVRQKWIDSNNGLFFNNCEKTVFSIMAPLSGLKSIGAKLFIITLRKPVSKKKGIIVIFLISFYKFSPTIFI